jgi:hypothetical protein
METVIYTHADNALKDTLLNEVAQVVQAPAMVFNFETLFNWLKSKITDQVVIVFYISSAEELKYLHSHKGRLFNTRYIIILSSRSETSISNALALYPRYLAYEDQGFKDVASVLNKMRQNNALRD